ncbi:MAG: methyltransferase domain-containing protein [Armatimonadetes bacterium]|nr:methyltransferase domain-containing protein [Armatimonadota bacterium]
MPKRSRRAELIARLARFENFTRPVLASTYLKGEGIEIGALHNPMPVSSKATVRYVDRHPREELLKDYPDVPAADVVPVDIVDDGETLGTVGDSSQDFIIASHMLEHTEDPIRTLKHFMRVLRPGGRLFLVVPDKRFTFDIDRPVTDFAHLLKDHEDGGASSCQSHYEEWVRLVMHIKNEEEVQTRVRDMMKIKESIHFHVWTELEFLEMMTGVRREAGLQFDVEIFARSGIDLMAVLSKS